MTREEVIQGLQFTIEMFLFDPSTGETLTEPRNNLDKATIDACKGAIELLKQEPCEDCISREEAINELKLAYFNKDLQSAKDDPCIVDAMTDWAIRTIKNLPSVQPQPKRGKWIKANGEENLAIWTCDQCGCKIYSETEYDRKKFHAWCGKCGCRMDADMREVQDEQW